MLLNIIKASGLIESTLLPIEPGMTMIIRDYDTICYEMNHIISFHHDNELSFI